MYCRPRSLYLSYDLVGLSFANPILLTLLPSRDLYTAAPRGLGSEPDRARLAKNLAFEFIQEEPPDLRYDQTIKKGRPWRQIC